MAYIQNQALTFGSRPDGAVTVSLKYEVAFSAADRYLNPFFSEQASLRRRVGYFDPSEPGAALLAGDAADVRITRLVNQFLRPSDLGMAATASTFVVSRTVEVALTAEEKGRLQEAGAGTAYAHIVVAPNMPSGYASTADAPIPGVSATGQVLLINKLPPNLASMVQIDSRVVSAVVKPPA